MRSLAGARIEARTSPIEMVPAPDPEPPSPPEEVPFEKLPVRHQLLKLGVDVGSIETFRLEEFPVEGPLMWLDRPDAEMAIEAAVASGAITPEQGRHAKELSVDGFTVYEGFFDADQLDAAWAAFEAGIASGSIPVGPEPDEPDPRWGRVPNVHAYVPEFNAILHDDRLRAELAALLGREVIPLQTISSVRGSEQLAHSDAIHMTTWPLGFLTAVWIAFEDIHPDSGPLVYYPGSHRLPYRLSKAYGIEPGEYEDSGRGVYESKYEPGVQ